mgnify:CR=1 FL=1
MKTSLLAFLILFIFTTFSFSQTERGSLILNGVASVDKNLGAESDQISAFFAPSLGYFVADGFLIGAGFSYYYADLGTLGNTSFFSALPFLRYYIRQNKPWSWFATLGYSYNRSEFDSGQLEIKYNYHSLYGGIGHNYFLNTNTAIEGILQVRYDFDEIDDQKSLLYDAGLQFFLPATKTENTAIAIGKGAKLIGLTANAGWANIGESDDLYLSVNPTLGFFVKDRLVLGSGLLLAFANQNAIFESQPFARYYFGTLGANLQPFATAGFGTRFQFADKADESGFFNFNLTGGLGADLFLTPTVALEGIFKYEGRQLEDADSKQQFLRFQVGLQFFLAAQ